MMEQLRYGILSTASIVPRFVNALKASGTGTAIAIASRESARAQTLGEELGIPKSYGSYEDLLADPEIDVVYVAMINSLHYLYAKKALQAGKHVICEKPMTLKTAEAFELFDEAKARGQFVTEAQKSVFLPVIQDVRAFLAEGKLGNVHLLDFTSSCAATYNGWLHSEEAGGGALFGNAGYCISLVQLLCGSIVDYNGLATFGSSEVEEQCVLNMNVGGKTLAVSKISTNVLTTNGLVIWGDLGRIEIPDYWKARTATVYLNSGETIRFEHPCQYELVYEIRHFDECIRRGLTESPVTSREATLQTLSILEHLSDTWRTQRTNLFDS